MTAVSAFARNGRIVRHAASARRVSVGLLFAWGLLHVVGGAALVFDSLNGSGRDALVSLGSAAAESDIPAEPGPVVNGAIGFHAANILSAGIAVSALALLAARRWPMGMSTALGISLVLDAWLIVFLLAPGRMAPGDGVWGPLLLVLAGLAAWRADWRPGQL